ncbi:hypothetical protein F2Q70_00001504 [Brassica cretica]|uniref:Uncharacterized protein n=1 Tax=Brassica cretica TaxID=69181 RepID=A0A8S9ISX8_BRACR|nr:hypothetical protein F2Q70_00001504 [Brassica cretica]
MSLERSKQICPSVSVTDLRVVFKRSAPFHFVAKHQHKQRELLRDFIETTASVFIQQQRRRTTQIFEEDDEDDVLSNNLSVKTNRSQNQIHELEDPHDQVKDFVGALIYDDYEDDFCRDPCHNTDVKSKEVDMSPQSRLISPIDIHEINGDMTRETLFDRPIVTRDIPCIDPLFNDEDEVQGFNNGGDFHVVVDDDNICVLKEHINYGLGEKDCHQQFHRKPPDRDRHKGLTNGFEYPKLLDETWHILKPEHGQEDCCYNDEFSYAAVSGPLELFVAKTYSRTENGWRSVIYATRTTGTSDTKITTTKYLCGISMGAHLIFLERPWKYDRRMSSNSFSNSFGNTYDFVFQDTKNTFYLMEETMDPVVLKKEIVSVSSTTSMQIGNVPIRG